jgi:hypothetical protein
MLLRSGALDRFCFLRPLLRPRGFSVSNMGVKYRGGGEVASHGDVPEVV